MPALKHFSDDQKEEIRKEIALFIAPYRVRFWLIIVGFLVGATIGLYGYKSGIDSATHNACVQDRQLIIGIVLRSVDANYAEYQANPEAVITAFKKIQEGNPQYKHNPKLLNATLQKTRDILNASDPANCPL